MPNRIQNVAQIPETLYIARRTPTRTGITLAPMTTLMLILGATMISIIHR